MMNIRMHFAGVLLAVVGGCNDSTVVPGEAFLTTTAPGPLTTVKAVKDELAAGTPELDVCLVGRIYAGPDAPPWEAGKAAFLIAESSHGNDTDHDPFGCPYCSRKIGDYQAFISFRDDDGNLIDSDAREFFGVADRQMIVIQGTATLDEDNDLQLNAAKMFVAPDGWTPSMPSSAEESPADEPAV